LRPWRLYSIRNKIINSSRDDWNKITCWGHGSGPSYRNTFGSYRGQDGEIHTEVGGHANLAILIDDIDISIASGYDPDEADGDRELDFSDFLPLLPDKTAHRMYADVFYGGSLVDRELLAVADGGRYYVPIPTTQYPNQKSPTDFSEPELHYSRWDIGFALVVQSFEHADSLDSVLGRMTYVLDEDGPIAGEGK
jgi:hypothetical protein